MDDPGATHFSFTFCRRREGREGRCFSVAAACKEMRLKHWRTFPMLVSTPPCCHCSSNVEINSHEHDASGAARGA